MKPIVIQPPETVDLMYTNQEYNSHYYNSKSQNRRYHNMVPTGIHLIGKFPPMSH